MRTVARFSPDRLRERFTELCEISSPTGEERAIADRVIGELRDLGLEVYEDDAAERAGSGAGNIVAHLPGRHQPGGDNDSWLMFCAHLDTVPHDGPIRVKRDENDVYRSVGETILGADNKAAVAVLLELAAGWSGTGPAGGDLLGTAGPPVGLELVFTVAEEEGLRGAKALDLDLLRAPFGFVIDHPSPIGELLTAAPTYIRVMADFRGVEAHAGIRPEQGRSAVLAAARAIARFKLGRLDRETTTNVGLIEGGSATNVVPGHCRLVGEVRSLDQAQAIELVREMSEVCADAAGETDCDLDFVSEEIFRGYRLPAGAESVKLAEAALSASGFEAVQTATGGGSDANAFNARGFECLLLANATTANHTPEEAVAGAELDRMLTVCDALLNAAALTAGEK